MRAALLVLAASCLLVPVASACHFVSGPPPGPGRFDVRSLDGAILGSITVADRELGGDCALANAYVLHGTEFAWVEGQGLRILDMPTGQVTGVQFPFHPRRVSADAQALSAADGTRVAIAMRPSDRAVEVPIPHGWGVLALDGAFAVLGQAPAAVRLYDLVNQTWAGPQVDRLYLATADRHWMVFDRPATGIALVRSDTGEHASFSASGSALSLDGARLWSEDGHDLVATDLATGFEERRSQPHPFPSGPIAEGRHVQRWYSASQAAPDEEGVGDGSTVASTPTPSAPTPHEAPLGFAPLLAVALALAWRRVRRQGTGTA